MPNNEDVGLFIAQTTLPFGPISELYNKITEGVFKNYRDNLKNNNDKTILYYAALIYLYKPKAYCMLGRWDLTIFSLVDDFEFGFRFFQPTLTDPFEKKNNLKNKNKIETDSQINYQVITALKPIIKGQTKTELFDFWKKYLQPGKIIFPLLGICALKVNNSLLIGDENIVFNRVLETLKQEIDIFKENNSIDYLILETGSWNEIELIVFGNSFEIIGSLFDKIKELEIQSLFNKTNKQVLLKNSLIKNYYKHKDKTNKYDLNKAHIFVKCITSLGFDFDFYKKAQEFSKLKLLPADFTKKIAKMSLKVDKNDKVKFIQRWNIKPGHLNNLKRKLHKYQIPEQNIDSNFNTQGISDFTLHFTDRSYSSHELVTTVLLTNCLDELDSDILQINTVPEIYFSPPPTKSGANITKPFLHFNNDLHKLKFKNEELIKLKENLRKIGVSRIVSVKLINIYLSFNENITDSAMFSYFLELKLVLSHKLKALGKMIDDVNSTILNEYSHNFISLNYINNDLEKFAEGIQKAYWNRFHQSHFMSDLSDHNFDFKGGIQQFLSSLNLVHTVFSKNSTNLNCFAYVSSKLGIRTENEALKLSLYYLFQPATYLATSLKEALNAIDEITPLHKDNLPNADKLIHNSNYADILSNISKGFAYLISTSQRFSIEKYLHIDTHAFIYLYKSNFELFSTWYLGSFFQLPEIYLTRNKIDIHSFELIVLRIFHVGFIAKEDIAPIIAIIKKSIVGIINEMELKRIVDNIQDKLQNFKSDYKQASALYLDWKKNVEEELPYDALSLVDTFYYHSAKGVKEKNYEHLFAGLSYKIRNYIYEYLDGHQIQIQKILLAKRNLVDNILERSSSKPYDCSTFFDRRAGMIEYCPQKRRERFKQTGELFRNLWGLNNVLKKLYALPLVDKELKLDSPKPEKRSISIFLSYTSEDEHHKSIVFYKLQNTLKDFKIDFYDFKIYKTMVGIMGNSIIENNSNYVKDSNYVIYFISLKSLLQPYCLNELFKRYQNGSKKNYFYLIDFLSFFLIK